MAKAAEESPVNGAICRDYIEGGLVFSQPGMSAGPKKERPVNGPVVRRMSRGGGQAESLPTVIYGRPEAYPTMIWQAGGLPHKVSHLGA
jgi:hypothetical protein